MPYCLPANYRRNVRPVPFDDHAPVTGQCAGWEWQPDVYPHAAQRAREIGANVLVDVGCGAGRKLAPFADEFFVLGLDRPEIIDRIDGITVAPIDLEDPDAVIPFPATERSVLICSDVIEHLVNPENAMLAMRTALESDSVGRLILSTPDRCLSNWTRRQGPPLNRGHVQEWALDELAQWMTDLGFTIHAAEHTRSNDHEPDLATCLIEASAA